MTQFKNYLANVFPPFKFDFLSEKIHHIEMFSCKNIILYFNRDGVTRFHGTGNSMGPKKTVDGIAMYKYAQKQNMEVKLIFV